MPKRDRSGFASSADMDVTFFPRPLLVEVRGSGTPSRGSDPISSHSLAASELAASVRPAVLSRSERIGQEQMCPADSTNESRLGAAQAPAVVCGRTSAQVHLHHCRAQLRWKCRHGGVDVGDQGISRTELRPVPKHPVDSCHARHPEDPSSCAADSRHCRYGPAGPADVCRAVVPALGRAIGRQPISRNPSRKQAARISSGRLTSCRPLHGRTSPLEHT